MVSTAIKMAKRIRHDKDDYEVKSVTSTSAQTIFNILIKIPSEMLFHIVTFLHQEDLVNFTYVSVYFSEKLSLNLVRDPSSPALARLENVRLVYDLATVSLLVSRAPRIKTLKLCNRIDSDDEDDEGEGKNHEFFIPKLGKSIRSFSAVLHGLIHDRSLLLALENCAPHLTSLSIATCESDARNYDIKEKDKFANFFPCLTSLDIRCSSGQTSHCRLLTIMPKLQRLRFRSTRYMIEPLDICWMTDLVRLELTEHDARISLDLSSCVHLTTFIAIEKVYFGAEYETEPNRYILPPSLQQLHVCNATSIPSAWQTLPLLRKFEVNSDHCTDPMEIPSFKEFSVKCPLLETFVLHLSWHDPNDEGESDDMPRINGWITGLAEIHNHITKEVSLPRMRLFIVCMDEKEYQLGGFDNCKESDESLSRYICSCLDGIKRKSFHKLLQNRPRLHSMVRLCQISWDSHRYEGSRIVKSQAGDAVWKPFIQPDAPWSHAKSFFQRLEPKSD